MKSKIKYLLVAFLFTPILFISACQNKNVSKEEMPKLTENQKLHKKVNGMSIDEKIGQLLVVKLMNNTQTSQEAIKSYHLGGVILSIDNFQGVSREDFIKRNKAYQDVSSIPLTISADQEGGTVTRINADPIKTETVDYPSPMEAYQKGGMKNTIYWAKKSAKDMKELGMNWNFAPVADVTNDEQSFIYNRTIGLDYEQTSKYISDVVPAMQSQGVAASVKHFPGYGSAGDTHNDSAISNLTKKEIMNHDVLPFKAGIKADVDSVMVTHVILNKIDPGVPASLSAKDISLLRDDLNYKGVIVSDSLQMAAASNYAKEHHEDVTVAAVKAGNDVVISSDYVNNTKALKEAVKDKEISVKQLNESVYRILKMKQKIGLKVM